MSATAAKSTPRVYAPLEKFSPSPTQPRRVFLELDELAASMSAHGQIDDVLVRVRPEGKLELVDGERRWRAAKQAGIGELAFSVRNYSDDEVIDIQIAEALGRVKLHPLEEADAFELARSRGRSVEDLGALHGRSPSFVYRRLVLRQLGENARKAFVAGQLTTAAAEILATVPAGKLQDEAVKDTCHRAYGEPASGRIAREVVGRFRLELVDARWKLDDAELLPKAGACSSCPKRTGAQPALFEDVTKDHCTDPACFAEKKSAHAKRAVDAAKVAGRTVLAQSDAKKLWPNQWSRAPEGAYVDLDTPSGGYEGKKWRSVLGKRVPAEVVVAVHPHTGDVHEIVERRHLKRALEDAPKKGDPSLDRASTPSSGSSAAEKKRQRIAKAKAEGHKRAAEELRTKLAAGLKGKLPDLLELVAHGVIERIYTTEVLERCAKRRGWDAAKNEDAKAVLQRAVVGPEQSCGLVIELIVEERLRTFNSYTGVEAEDFVARVMDYMGVDWLEHEKTAIAQLEERLEKKVSKKKTAKKAPKRGAKK
jgi:ParB/RepB/Spo0J family partition protein